MCLLETQIPDVPRMLYMLAEFENDIRQSLMNGEKT